MPVKLSYILVHVIYVKNFQGFDVARTTVDDEVRRGHNYPSPPPTTPYGPPQGPYHGYPYHYGHPIPPDHFGYSYGYDAMNTYRSTMSRKNEQSRSIDRRTASRLRRKPPRLESVEMLRTINSYYCSA